MEIEEEKNKEDVAKLPADTRIEVREAIDEKDPSKYIWQDTEVHTNLLQNLIATVDKRFMLEETLLSDPYSLYKVQAVSRNINRLISESESLGVKEPVETVIWSMRSNLREIYIAPKKKHAELTQKSVAGEDTE